MIVNGLKREQRLYEQARQNVEKMRAQLDETRRAAQKMLDSVESYMLSLAHTEPLRPIFDKIQGQAAGQPLGEWRLTTPNEQLNDRHYLMKQGRKWQALYVEMNDLVLQMTKQSKELFQLLVQLTDSVGNAVSFKELTAVSLELVKDILNKAMTLSKLLAKPLQVAV